MLHANVDFKLVSEAERTSLSLSQSGTHAHGTIFSRDGLNDYRIICFILRILEINSYLLYVSFNLTISLIFISKFIFHFIFFPYIPLCYDY